ncbi:MAG: arsenical pump rane protein [Acidimicrobiaceae bacterium]|jgi:arsenical pump membrane protein|nr:arsenical pump rane protein [Acidimicrobiaceae bacterium]
MPGGTVGPDLVHSLSQTWPPFVLIAGLLLIGTVAASDGLFEATGAALARLPGGGLVLFGSMMALVAAVTVVLNLDTSVVFLTPILLHAARHRKIDETAFLYGAVFMSNSASLLLPGSNLTNLLVLADTHISGSTFAAHMFPAWIAAVAVTALVVVVWRHRDWRQHGGRDDIERVAFRMGFGLVGLAAAVVLVLVVPSPAIPVAAAGVIVAGAQVLIGRLSLPSTARAVNVPVLTGLFVLATVLGTVARLWDGPGRLMASLGSWATAWVGVGTASLINNLPAAVLLSARPPAHPRALLIGLDLGPNLVITGSLSAIFWMRVARAERARPSALTYSKVGVVLVPLSVAASLLALSAFSGG